MSIYILPVFLILIFLIGFVKKVPLYNTFGEGAKEAVKLTLSIFPYICSIFIVMELFNVSGLSGYISKAFSPLLELLGIPSQLAQLLIIRPLSGNGSVAMLKDIFAQYGVDSYISRCACVIVGCSETVFYVSAVYFSTTRIRKLRYALPVSLFSCLFGSIVACLICRVL